MLERLGEQIRLWRTKRAMTQQELADKAGLSREFIARLEHGRQDPAATTLARIAKALRIPIANLFR